ncbi:APC family permease [Sulfurimonas sp. HSL-1716]|uniref:APC family permease n=1 Tax=Hydrocurvibacter sulfurireducens TaxID=3131937 RepID=UPI0031F8B0FF
MGFLEAFSIGVGGMVGGGIFAVLGLTIDLSRGGAPVAFIIAGILALVTAYSYVKLSLRYPSEGGTIEFIVQAFGNRLFSSIINNLLLISYVIMLALYAYAFGSYGAVLSGHSSLWVHKVLSSGIILFFVFINILGALLTGRAEDVMVFIKIIILLVFAGAGLLSVDWTHMAPHNWMPLPSVAAGGFMIFLAYEGFELIANTARDVRDPQINLPRAYYASVIFVILLYIVISAVAVGNLSFAEAKSAQDYVLAKAAEPFFGQAGFVFISIAALLSTASAINATIYGSGRISYIVAKLGELPAEFETKIKHGYEGMVIIGILAVIFTTLFNLDNISVAGSMGFLIVFGLVNLANFRLYKQTGSNRFVPLTGALFCTGAAITLITYTAKNSPDSLGSSLVVLFGVLIFSYLYNHLKGKKLSAYIDKELEREERFLKKLL